MQMNDFFVSGGIEPRRRELLQFIAHADNHIRLIEAEVDIIVHHEAHGPEGVGVVVRKDPLAVEGRGHRNLQLFGEADQGLLRPVAGRPVSGQDDGGPGRLQQPGRLGDLGRVRGRGLHRMHGQGPQRRFDRQRFHVLGDGQIDGAGPLRLGQVEGVADHLGRRPGVRRVSAHLVTGLNMAHQVHHLMGLLVDPPQAHLGAEGHQRGAVRLGVGDPEQQVDGPGAEGGEANPRLAGDPAVHLGHEGGALLRAHQDKAHGRIVEGIHQVDDLLAGETEDVILPLRSPGIWR